MWGGPLRTCGAHFNLKLKTDIDFERTSSMVFPSLFPNRYAEPGIEESFLIQDPTRVASLTEEQTLGVCGTRYGLISIHSHDQSVYGTTVGGNGRQ